MQTIVPKVRFSVKERLLRGLRRCREAGLRLRYLIVVNLLSGRPAYRTAEALGVHNTTVPPSRRSARGQRVARSGPCCQTPFRTGGV